jgi:hypothetical protein
VKVLKKVYPLILIIVILCNLLGSIVSAAPAFDVESSKTSVLSKIQIYNNTLDNTYKGQYGLLYNLYYLTLLTRWTDFLYNTPSLQFSILEKELYRKSLISKVETFNKKFSQPLDSTNPNYYAPVPIVVEQNADKFLSMLQSFIGVDSVVPGTVIEYLQRFMDDLNLQLTPLKTDKIKYDALIEKHKASIRYIYLILDVLINENSQMGRLMPPSQSGVDDFQTTVRNSQAASDLLKNPKYSELMQLGRSLSKQTSTSPDSIGFKNANTFIETFANVQKSGKSEADGGVDYWCPESSCGGNFTLKSSYMTIFAASAVYRPFVSHLGDPDFMNALQGITGTDFEELSKSYSSSKDYKKPLYVIDKVLAYKNSGKNGQKNYSGKAKLLSVKDLLDRVEKETETGLVTVKGAFRMDGMDANSWSFFPNSYTYYGVNNQTQTTPTQPTAGATTPQPSPSPSPVGNAHPTSQTPEKSVNSNELVVPSLSTITTDQFTPLLYQFGTLDGRAINSLMILKNYLKDFKGQDSTVNLNTQFLFINPFGDIVTQDNLVIIPGAANPNFYDEQKGYNPYTVAFMKGYPKISYTNSDLTINKNDIGKYLMLGDGDEVDSTHTIIQIKGEGSLSMWSMYKSLPLYTTFFDSDGSSSKVLFKSTGSIPGFFRELVVGQRSGIVFDVDKLKAMDIQQRAIGGASIITYDPAEDSRGIAGRLIAKNMYNSLISNGGQITSSANGRLLEDLMFRSVLVETVNGTAYGTAFVKNVVTNYVELVEDQFNWLHRIIINWNKNSVATLGGIDGVLGLKNSYEDPILSKVLYQARTYFWYALIILFMIFLVKFMRDQLSLTYTLILSTLALGVFYAFINIIPVYLPQFYNLVVNNLGQNLSYNVMETKAEQYMDTYGKSGQVDGEGKFVENTTSLNLYRLSAKDLSDAEARYKIPRKNLELGDQYILDSKNGVYLQGDTLKVNTDLLLYTNPITGYYPDENSGDVYQLKADKQFSSVLEYYTPYYQLQDGFIKSLNAFLKVYRTPRNVATYYAGFQKDSFVVFNYVNSEPFLTPGKIRQMEDTTPEQMQAFESLFKNSDDILNLNEMLKNPSPAMQESLWYRTLKQNGYTPEEKNSKRYNDLVSSVNFQVKKFLIDMKPQASLISDENMIKMVSIYATTVFNQKASDYANWLYPVSVNFEQFKLKDVLLAVFTNDYTRFMAQKYDVAEYVAGDSGFWGSLFLAVVLILAFAINSVITFGIAVIYLMFAVLLLIRFSVGSQLKTVTTGYLKVTAIMFVCYTLYVAALNWSSHFSTMGALLFLLIVFGLIFFILSEVVSSVLMNITDLGNNRLNVRMQKWMDKSRLSDVINSLKVGTTNLLRRDPTEEDPGSYKRYAHEYNVDSGFGDERAYLERVNRIKSRRSNTGTESYINTEETPTRERVDSGSDYGYGDLKGDMNRYKN